MFVLLVFALIILALFFVLPPLLKNSSLVAVNRDSANLEVTRQQISDIEDEVNNDLIADDQLRPIREEAENTLMMELKAKPTSPGRDKSKRFFLICAIGVSLFIPVFSFLVYLSVGAPDSLLSATGVNETQSEEPSLTELISKLEQRLAQNPADQEGWLVLAQTNMIMQRFPQAVEAMEQLYQLSGESPDVLARYADTLTMANNGRFTDKAIELFNKALELDPNHVHALWLAGIQAFQAEQFDTAVNLFKKARVNIDDPENLAQIDELIKNAQQKSGASSESPQTTPAVSITVKVDVSATLKENIDPGQTLFIFAKAANGPPMPLAVSKHKASELPLEVVLDDSMAMMPDMALSGFDQVVVSARISTSDQPIAQPGDLQGEASVINPQLEDEVKITINQIVE